MHLNTQMVDCCFHSMVIVRFFKHLLYICAGDGHQMSRIIWLLMIFLVVDAFHNETVQLTCVPCNATEFCHAGLRARCPANSRSDPNTLPNEIGDCVCVPGYLREGDVCNLGLAPYWYIEGVQQTCAEFPRRVTVVSGASRAAQCVCVPGYEEVGGLCTRCPPDYFNEAWNSTCVQCPDHASHTQTAEARQAACTCDAGYTGPDGGPCAACEPGQFKAANGSAACETCVANTYSNGGASAACVPCHGNSTSATGSAEVAECLCDPGYELVAGVCVQCAAGKFKRVSGNEACKLCATDDEFAGAVGATECETCYPNSHSEATRERCLCDAGYVQASGADLHPTCSACPVDTYQNLTGQTACVDCDVYAQAPAASPDIAACLCNAGYFDVEYGACQACAPGQFKDTVDETEACSSCPEHSDSAAAAPALTACICDPGYEGSDGGPCLACDVGKFKARNGSAPCEFCEADTYADSTATVACTPCFAHSLAPVGSTDQVDCICDWASGYVEVADDGERACSACAPGKYASSDASETGAGCVNCSFGTFTYNYGQTVCSACAENTSSHSTPRTECECDAGFRCPNLQVACDGACEACEADTFKVEPGYSQTCTACQEDAQSPPASTTPSACLCNVGFFHEQEYSTEPPYTCAACAPGSYTDVAGKSVCTGCAQNYYTPQALHPWDTATDCVACALCPMHHFDAARDGLGCALDVPTLCQACPANSGTSHNDTLSLRNTNVTACACNAGYFGPLGGPCELCPAGFVKLERLDRDTTSADCIECPVDTYMTTQDAPCKACLAHSSSFAGSFQKQHCACAAGRENVDPEIRAAYDAWGDQLAAQDLSADFAGTFEDEGTTVCRRCARGFFKPLPGADPCGQCPADTFQNSTGAAECESCPLNMSSLNAATQCYCDPSFENADGEHHDCTLCVRETFKTEFGDQHCAVCATCGANEQVDEECSPGSDITCRACQNNSWTPAGRSRRGPCLCNAGFELVFDEQYADGYACVACTVGKYRTTDTNNSVPCRTCKALTYTTDTQTVLCSTCTALCDDAGDTSTRAYYVHDECVPERDIICAKCTVCVQGSYANRTCGSSFDNDRADTTCAVCPVGFYCPGNGTQPQACPAHSTSAAGSVSGHDCACNPGYYTTDVHLYGAEAGELVFDTLGLSSHLCFACDVDTYCTGDGTVTQCPAHAFTLHKTSTHRLDCQCFPGYFRTGESDTFDTTFECTLCTPNDYCFNNSRYNCSDERMLSDAGSAYFANCTCMAGFYNNGTRCDACHVDTYCVGDGLPRACPAHEWTSGERQYSECYCRPGYYSPTLSTASPKGCELCPVDSFCTGEFDARFDCTSHSTSDAGSALDTDCLCLPGFGNVSLFALLPDDTPTFHACAACAPEFFKETASNEACAPCTVCLPIPDGVYELQACRADYDARCDACNPCTNGSIWTSQACALKADAVCSLCRQCDYSVEYLDELCTPQQNAVCRNISYDLVCPVGAFAGGHTERQDSFCAPCVYRDTPYFSQRLHEAASTGTRYNDAYSCEIRCLGLSRMLDAHNDSLGCVSCETGNVLLREFSVFYDLNGRATDCQFTCRTGFEFDAARNDCFAPVLRASAQNAFTHTLNVTNWRRSALGFIITVAHTNHSRFVVVAGRSKPTSCRHDECCFRELWRVSDLHQLGLTTPENCSRAPELSHNKISSASLEFEIPDSRLAEVSRCSFVNLTEECFLVISLIDTVLQRAISTELVLRTSRAVAYAFFNTENRYIPLDSFVVDVMLAQRDFSSATYLVVTQLQSTRGVQNVTLRVQGMTFVAYECPHYAFQNDTAQPDIPSILTSDDRLSSFVTYWRGPPDISIAQLYYSLSASSNDVMDIAAVRNVTHLEPVCTRNLHTNEIQLGVIDAAAGLGQDVIEEMHRIHSPTTPTTTTRGALGSLVSFVAISLSPFTTRITVKDVLAAHASGRNYELQNATEMRNGVVDFRYSFRLWCRAHPKCVYEYLHLDTRGRSMHIVNCSEGGRAAARVWLVEVFGIVTDNAHVEALCQRVAASKYKALAFMVNTLAYTKSLWHTEQNVSSRPTESYIWPNLRFDAN